MAVQKRPDWDLWGKIPDAELWKLIVVSMDIEPGFGAHESLSGERQRHEYEKRRAISESCIYRKQLPVVQMPSVSQNRNIEHAIVEPMEFGAFAKRQKWGLPDLFPVDPVNWEQWGRMDAAPLWQAVLLSIGRSPDVSFDDMDNAFAEPYAAVRNVAISSLGRGLRRYKLPDPDDTLAMFSVDERTWVFLTEFRVWAEGKGYKNLPNRFPRVTATYQMAASEAKPDAIKQVAPSSSSTKDGSVMISLPHVTKDLEAVFKVMREFWTKYDPESPPKQTAIARKLDEALRWAGNKDGGPSRSAQQVASMIRPDAIGDTDKRRTKRRR